MENFLKSNTETAIPHPVKAFLHSGDLGDIIFSLPVIKAVGGGILYLDPLGGKGTGKINLGYKDYTNLNSKGIMFLKPLLESQSYIKQVRFWGGEYVDYDLDKFRNHINYNNLAKSHLAAFNLDLDLADKQWLEINSEPYPGKKYVLSRTPKVQGNHEFWEFKVRELAKEALFVGLPKEHEIFEYALGYEVDYKPVSNALELARIINWAQFFIGNQSLAHAIAEGLKKPLICEVNRNYPAAVFKRPDAQYV